MVYGGQKLNEHLIPVHISVITKQSNCLVQVQSIFSLLYEREVLINTEMSLKVRQ